MRLAMVAASDQRTFAVQITGEGHLRSRWLDTTDVNATWTDWEAVPFDGHAVAVAALSGWDQQIEIFVLTGTGQVWNRWWWADRGWTPTRGFNPLGAPFPSTAAAELSAFSAGGGHFNLFVQSTGGTVAMLPHISGLDGPSWRRCTAPNALGDGWWPAFAPGSRTGYPSPLRSPLQRP